MHVISLIVRIRLPLVSSQSDQYQKIYGCFSYSDVVKGPAAALPPQTEKAVKVPQRRQ